MSNNTLVYVKSGNGEVKEEIKEEMLEHYEEGHDTLEGNIDEAIRNGTLGLVGK